MKRAILILAVLASSVVALAPARAATLPYYWCYAAGGDSSESIISSIRRNGDSNVAEIDFNDWLNNNYAPSGNIWVHGFPACLSFNDYDSALSRWNARVNQLEDAGIEVFKTAY